MTLKEILASNVRIARTARGWTQAELAERSGLSPNAVGRLERGRTALRFDNIERAAAALGLDPPALLSAEPPVPPTPQRARAIEALKGRLSRMSDADLERVERLIRAMEG